MKWLYIVAALVVFQIGVWAFTPAPPPPPKKPESTRAYGPTENITVEGRKKQRETAFRALELPTGSRCTPEGRKDFISGLDFYYYHRQNQMRSYPETYGRLGSDYIAKQWASPDDRRIDRLTQEAYSRGYLKLDDFKGFARTIVQSVVKDEKVIGKGCA